VETTGPTKELACINNEEIVLARIVAAEISVARSTFAYAICVETTGPTNELACISSEETVLACIAADEIAVARNTFT
jgi:hypothetical protein